MTQLITKAVIPAAGLGTRLLPLTKSQPKEMLPVGRKPVIQYVLEELQAANLRQILVVTGIRKRAIEDHFDSDPELIAALEQAGNEAVLSDLSYMQGKSRFFYTRQSTPRGLGHAISLAADFADDEDFVVALGDSLIAAEDPASPLRAMMRAHRDLGAAAIIAVERVPQEETFRYGIVSIGGEEPPPEALRHTLPDRRGEIQISDAIKVLIQQGKPVYAWLLAPEQRRYDVGNFESYFEAFVDFALADERYGYLVRKHVKRLAYEL
jgi:UTP--glucose-1-phosphate uridylyltransferase